MAESGDLISFDAIEIQKENIQSLPGGRSAKQLALFCSPLAAAKSPSLSQSQDLKNRIKQDFEKELAAVDDADDPLDVYDRYIKWTMQAYPSAQATHESNLLPLIEKATKAFLSGTMYKNDPRYLKLWLLYIKLFADSPRETYAFLAKHGVGDGLALYYEEFAAWLESNGRWSQAEEVFATGIDKDARPRERLIRKYAEFQHRHETKTAGDDGPASPALPTMRPALAAKSDPFAAGAESDPQMRDRAEAAAAAARGSRPARAKMAIFADSEEPARANSSGSGGWESLGSLADRKKENSREAKPWAGETLDGGKKTSAGPKMTVFRDPVSGLTCQHSPLIDSDRTNE
jgi:checkpoint serine/threonine-protein kinase